jgi:hypothetical protein
MSINQDLKDIEVWRNKNNKECSNDINTQSGAADVLNKNFSTIIKSKNIFRTGFSTKNYTIELRQQTFHKKFWCTVLYGFCYFRFNN